MYQFWANDTAESRLVHQRRCLESSKTPTAKEDQSQHDISRLQYYYYCFACHWGCAWNPSLTDVLRIPGFSGWTDVVLANLEWQLFQAFQASILSILRALLVLYSPVIQFCALQLNATEANRQLHLFTHTFDVQIFHHHRISSQQQSQWRNQVTFRTMKSTVKLATTRR